MANIKNNIHRKIDCKIIKDTYLDFVLSKDNAYNNNVNENDFAAILNFNDIKDKHVISDIAWENAVSTNEVLKNIGYTGVDNGFITYERDMIGNDEFVELYANSTFDLSTFNDKFFITEVNGNNAMLSYPIEKHNDYVTLKGGFYQGFFKLKNYDYQTLPHRIEDEWNFNFTLRPRNYETNSNILNKRNEDNEGIFFFIGTRAENKFWELYKHRPEMENYKYDNINEYSVDYDIMDITVNKHQYLDENSQPIIFNDEEKENNITNDENLENETSDENLDIFNQNCSCGKNEEYDDYFLGCYNPYEEECNNNENESDDNINGDSSDDNINGDDSDDNVNEDESDNEENLEQDSNCDYFFYDENYFQEQLDLDTVKLTDSKGFPIGENGFFEIKTDNKFITFNNTKNGYNINTWKDEYQIVLTGKSDEQNINYFPYLNQTKTGYTIYNIDELKKDCEKGYNVLKDIENNALALKINKNGSISYRYLSNDCELIEETSLPNIIKYDEWNNIHLKIIKKNGNTTSKECDNNYMQGIMQLYIYVSGKLKMVSQELPELMLNPLKERYELQEGVPYSLSIGGGTQGLSERIILDYYDRTDYILPIEKYFAGSFIGDIKKFTFIPKQIQYSTIYQLNK